MIYASFLVSHLIVGGLQLVMTLGVIANAVGLQGDLRPNRFAWLHYKLWRVRY